MHFLVVDIGTSTCRASVVSEKGEIISQSHKAIYVDTAPPFFAEVDTHYIWQQVKKVIAAEIRKNSASVFEAIGVSSMLGYVFLDQRNCPLMPAIIWMDNRATEETEKILQDFSEEELYQKTGRKLSSELLAPKIRWLYKHRPDIAKRIRKIIGLKDDIVRRLTGVVQTDVVHLNYTSLYNVQKGELDSEILSALEINESLFPEPFLATDIAGSISETVARETGLKSGIPVIAGSSDGTTAMYGGGVLEEHKAVLVSGTTDVLMVCSHSPLNDPSYSLNVNTGVVPGTFLIGGTMGLTGGTLGHIEGLLHESADNVEKRIAQLEPGSNGLLFFPGLTGERSPYWKRYVTGGIAGLTLEHQAEHIFRAIMEGTSFRILKLLQVLKENHLAPKAINTVGGCSNMDIWNQIRADVTGLEINRLSVTEATALGTALFCKAGIDNSRSLREMAKDWIGVEQCYSPDSRATERYKKIAELFDAYMNVNEDIYRSLNDLTIHRS